MQQPLARQGRRSQSRSSVSRSGRRGTCGPVLTRLRRRLALARSGRVSRGWMPSCSRRTLSHRLVGWCGVHFRGLQAEGSPNNGVVRGRARQSRDAVRGDRGWSDRGAHPEGCAQGAGGLPLLRAALPRVRRHTIGTITPSRRRRRKSRSRGGGTTRCEDEPSRSCKAALASWWCGRSTASRCDCPGRGPMPTVRLQTMAAAERSSASRRFGRCWR
jgi:hypothetical protein